MKKLAVILALLTAPAFAQTWSVAFNTGPGTVVINNGSTTITGTSTAFSAADVDAYICDNAQVNCQRVASQSSTTAAVLSVAWAGTSLSGAYGFQQWCHAPANASFTVTCPANFTAGNFGVGAAYLDNLTNDLTVTITDGNGVGLFSQTTNSPCVTAGADAGHLWEYYTPYLFGGSTATVSFAGAPGDVPNDVWFVEINAQAGYVPTFDTDTGSCASTTSSTDPTSTMTLGGSNELVLGVAGGGTSALKTPYTSYYDATDASSVGYDLNASSSITTTLATTGTGPGGVYAAAYKWVPWRTSSLISGNATLTGSVTLNAVNPASTIAGVCTPTAGTSTSGTATTGTCNSTGASLEVCSVASSNTTGSSAPFSAFGDSLANAWQATPWASHSGNGVNQLFWVVNPTTGSSQTFHVTVISGQRVTLLCRAYSGTVTTTAVLDQQPSRGYGAGTTCKPATLIPAQYGDLVVISVVGNGLSGGTPTVATPFAAFTVEVSNTSEWDSGLADSIMTTVQPAAPTWTVTSDSGLSCMMAIFMAHQ